MAMKVYNPSQAQVSGVDKILKLLESKNVLGVRFDDSQIRPKIGDLKMVQVEMVKDHSVLLVHWEPMPSLSRQADPCCSAYILRPEELDIIYETLNNFFKRNP